ncbi:YcxB family protein [Clostridium sp. AM58-1XD]|uniref:YcxB family protein n=1 Tax=Clostridium sp. AM58-1XD TaxID=2292307 RepID=UPI000E46751F|nr:YcxB family protein [Clostridium sp. AM58-1XD]RGZ00618.1 YcxB family protein [Clostridium sp. AM58-1XD]
MDTEQTGAERFFVQTRMTEEIYQYGSKGFRKYSFQNGGWKIWAFFLVSIPLSGAGMLFARGAAGRIYSFIFGVLVLVFLPLFFVWATRKMKIGQAYRKIVDEMEGNIDQSYVFYEDCVKMKRWYIEETMKYSFLVFMLELPDMFMLFTRSNTIYYFRKDEITGGTAREFREFIEEKAGLKTEYAAVKG